MYVLCAPVSLYVGNMFISVSIVFSQAPAAQEVKLESRDWVRGCEATHTGRGSPLKNTHTHRHHLQVIYEYIIITYIIAKSKLSLLLFQHLLMFFIDAKNCLKFQCISPEVHFRGDVCVCTCVYVCYRSGRASEIMLQAQGEGNGGWREGKRNERPHKQEAMKV